MSVDTGFDYHCDVEVSGKRVRPDKESIQAMRRNLEGVAARDRVRFTPAEEKWFQDDGRWIYVLGVRRRETVLS